MRVCSYCGSENDAGRESCGGCGTALPNAGPSSGMRVRASRGIFGTALLLAAVISLVIFFATFASYTHVYTVSDGIKIRGTREFKEQVESALILLRSRSPGAYQITTNYIGMISQAEHSGMRAYRRPPTFDLNDRTAFYSQTWCAGAIAHDSFHSKLYNEYKKAHPGGVPDEVWTGREVEKQCLKHQLQVLQEIGAPFSEISYCASQDGSYGTVKYKERDW